MTGDKPEDRGDARRVACQFSVYPLGTNDYMDTIYRVVALTKERNTYAGSSHFCTRLEGRIDEVFATLADAFALASEGVDHTVMVVTLSCNSPTITSRSKHDDL